MKETVLLTGATSGIGLELAKQLAANHYNLILVGRNEEKLTSLKSTLLQTNDIAVDTFLADLSNVDEAKKLFSKIENAGLEIDILINNAGVGMYGTFSQTDLEQELSMIGLNVSTLVTMTKLCLLQMTKRGKGHIVNISSILGHFPFPYYTVYGATKAFVLMFSESLQMELVGSGIAMTTICPGPTKTPFYTQAMLNTNASKKMAFAQASEVASETIKAMKAKKGTVVLGFMNRMTIMASKWGPSWLNAKINTFMASQSQ